MGYWILKSEPSTYCFDQLVTEGRAVWDGIRNYQARNNLRAMKLGDEAFVYHSNEGKDVVGIAKISKEAYPEPGTTDDWSVVEIIPVKKLKRPVNLEELKADPILKNISLVKQSRLSVCPLSQKEFKRILELSETTHV
jgi:predicted RNA-binding protein with PUA-like domain